MWWKIDASKGRHNAKENRAIIEKEMFPAQLGSAQRFAREGSVRLGRL